MKRIRPGWKPALSLAVVTLFAFTATPRAAKPFVFPIENSGTNVWTDGCSFPITYDFSNSGTATLFFDETGAVVRVLVHLTEQDTFYANGKTVTGTPYTFTIEVLVDSSGNITRTVANGLAGKARLPDGGLFIVSGQIDFVGQGFPTFSFTPDAGAIVNLDGLCAALAP